jgi:hypothetical protein
MKAKRISARQLKLLSGFVRDDGDVWQHARLVCDCGNCLAAARSVARAKLAVLESWPDGSTRLRLTDIGKLALCSAPRA